MRESRTEHNSNLQEIGVPGGLTKDLSSMAPNDPDSLPYNYNVTSKRTASMTDRKGTNKWVLKGSPELNIDIYIVYIIIFSKFLNIIFPQ